MQTRSFLQKITDLWPSLLQAAQIEEEGEGQGELEVAGASEDVKGTIEEDFKNLKWTWVINVGFFEEDETSAYNMSTDILDGL